MGWVYLAIAVLVWAWLRFGVSPAPTDSFSTAFMRRHGEEISCVLSGALWPLFIALLLVLLARRKER